MKSIAERIDDLFYGFDTYLYKGIHETREEGIAEIENNLIFDFDAILQVFRNVAESEDEESKEELRKIISDMINDSDKSGNFGTGDELFQIIGSMEDE